MITEIFEYLTSDSELSSLLDHYPYDNKLKIFFGRPQAFSKEQTDDKGSFIDFPYIVYNVVPYSKDLIATDYRVQVTIVARDEMKLDAISERVATLLNIRNQPSFKINEKVVYHSQLMTGGSLLFHEKENVFEQINYFIIKTKG
jgi:hypothetical protein